MLYGNETKTIDVSNILNKMILENQLYISKKINLNWLFTDPCPNHKKSLKIKFSYGNIDYNSEFKENRSKLNESVFIFDLNLSIILLKIYHLMIPCLLIF